MSHCKDCVSEENKQYRNNNRDKILGYRLRYKAIRYEKYKTTIDNYNKRNKKKIQTYQKQYRKDRRRIDICFKLRYYTSTAISNTIRLNSGYKYYSTWNKLPYTPLQLKSHLESLFEPWMSWENHGKYNPNKQTWQIDHIVPQSKLPYDSMDHPNFLKCWSLENLRPLETVSNLRKNNKIADQKLLKGK